MVPPAIVLGARTETALWERLWERAQCANAQLLNFQQEAGAPEEIRTPDPQIRSLVVGPAVLALLIVPNVGPAAASIVNEIFEAVVAALVF